MKGTDIFLGLGYVDEDLIEEAEFGRFSSGTLGHWKAKKVLLVAALAAMMLLLVGCGAAIYARIQMQVVDNRPTSPSELSVEEIFTTYYPQTIPEGYECFSGTSQNDTLRNLYYENSEGVQITFSLTTSLDLGEIPLVPPVEKTDVEVGSLKGTLTISQAGAQNLVWEDPDMGFQASLTTEDMTVDLIAMAESVAAGAPMELSFFHRDGEPWDAWYPQQLPEGYERREVTELGEDGVQSIDYYKEGGGSLQYVISTKRDLSDIGEAPHSTMVWEDVDIAGTPGRKVSIGDHQWILFWNNEAEGFNASLTTDDPNLDLIEIAKTVGPGPKLEPTQLPLPGFTLELEQSGEYVGYEPWYPQWLPEGYAEHFISDRAYGEQTIRYKNAQDMEIVYTFYFRLGQWGRSFESDQEPQQVDINGHVGYQMGNSVVWTDAERGFAFQISAPQDVDVLKIARSVAAGPERPATRANQTEKALKEQGDYQITALPKGMFEDGLTGSPVEDGGDWYGYVRRWYFSKESKAEIYFEYETYITEEQSTPEVMNRRYFSGDETSAAETEIAGCPGLYGQEGDTAQVAWATVDGNHGMQFHMTSQYFTAEELMEIAQSVQKMN